MNARLASFLRRLTSYVASPNKSLGVLPEKLGVRSGKNTSKVFACPKVILKGLHTELRGDAGRMCWVSTTSCPPIFYIGDSRCMHLVYWYDSLHNKVQSTDSACSYSKVASKCRRNNRILLQVKVD